MKGNDCFPLIFMFDVLSDILMSQKNLKQLNGVLCWLTGMKGFVEVTKRRAWKEKLMVL